MKQRFASFSVRWCAVIGCSLSLAGFVLAATAYSEGFRRWVHVKSAIVTSGHPAAAAEGGIHHIYANPQAVAGYVSGQFADGSTIVYELLAANEKDGIISEGARRRVDMMIKDSARFPDTGGWRFERFNASGENTGLGSAQKMCFDCHARQRDHGFVFSRMR